MSDSLSEADRKKIIDNLAYNQQRWGSRETWEKLDSYGYNWSQMHAQPMHATAPFIAENYLIPSLPRKSGLAILEVAPGAGRFTTELIRLSSELYLLDLNEQCIEICKERFRYYSHIKYFINDGISCEMIPNNTFDLVASYDSFVHIEPAIVKSYLIQFTDKLLPNGIVWLHHSARGENPSGHRTAMTDEIMKGFAEECGLELLTQHYIHEGKDCISILKKKK